MPLVQVVAARLDTVPIPISNLFLSFPCSQHRLAGCLSHKEAAKEEKSSQLIIIVIIIITFTLHC